ncbi:GNAT family N-acetyltransferase [Amycolatopsis pittospori]|uniref:GNAT family N-acetyltransferase n=1 Tax=Amycolatopsis pittospori TaxID=2749434 RepID=UPI002E2A57BD|nr:GNAT family N-acetyltransferase [Amycolatopsis pittospori]
MPQATLHTDRLELVPLSDEHIDLEVEIDADPLVLRYLAPRARTRDEAVAAHAERMKRGTRVDGLGLWVGFTVCGPQREFAGLWMLQPPHGPSQTFTPGEADLGFRLQRRWWRQRYASEGARELLRHGFDDLKLTRIFAQTMAVNRPSRATLETLGMHYVRSFHEDYDEPVPGSEHGEVEYEIRRTDWPPRQTALL